MILPTRFSEPPPSPQQQLSQKVPNDKIPYILVPAASPNFIDPAYFYGPTALPTTEPPKTTHKKRKSGNKTSSTKKPEVNQSEPINPPKDEKFTNVKAPAVVEPKPMPSSSNDKAPPQVQIVTPTKATENLVVPTEVIETSTDADKYKNRKPKFQ